MDKSHVVLTNAKVHAHAKVHAYAKVHAFELWASHTNCIKISSKSTFFYHNRPFIVVYVMNGSSHCTRTKRNLAHLHFLTKNSPTLQILPTLFARLNDWVSKGNRVESGNLTRLDASNLVCRSHLQAEDTSCTKVALWVGVPCLWPCLSVYATWT